MPDMDVTLGVTYNAADESAELRLWAPSANQVLANFYSPRNADRSVGEPLQLSRDSATGVWHGAITARKLGLASLKGVFYQYSVDGRKALDPYAKSMAANNGGIGKGAIIDDNSFRVSGFASIDGYRQREDAIIYEVDVRDFTVDPNIETELGNTRFGTYSAFIKRLDYIQRLGVTHIQLMPVMAYLYGDERKAGTREWEYKTKNINYNWGYDPQCYFSPEGMYASDPADPQARVDELKRLIQAIHDHHMGVTLDVVYNHQPTPAILNAIEPGYYYRNRNDSLAGADLATERPMVRKLIIDSLVYWTRQYHVDGFRFDLMGLIDAKTMTEAYQAVSKIDPATLFIGEGWRMYHGPPMEMADQDWVMKQDFAAVFSDDFRDVIKSGYNDEGKPRFITGGTENIDFLFRNLKGEPSKNFRADDPGDVVQYIAAHDNLTLHDVISVATGLDPDISEQEDEIQRRIRLGNTLVLTSQGIAFLHAGQEYGRTKRWRGKAMPERDATRSPSGAIYINNSYDSPDVVNYFDWSRVDNDGSARQTMLYTRGLIAIRRSTDAFRLGNRTRIDTNVNLIYPSQPGATDRVIAWSATAGNGDTYYVFVNADDTARRFDTPIDLTGAQVLADGKRAGTSPIASPAGVDFGGAHITLTPLTAAILKIPGANG